MSSAKAAHPTREWLGHPRGLFYLFLTEMWERFSYYGMRALLVLYMVNYLFADPERARRVLGYDAMYSGIEWFLKAFGFPGELTTQVLSSQIYGFYTGFVYLTPFFGGILADRIFGQKKTVYVGGVLMAIGHFLMASESAFFLALLFLILGNGCFKPNISTQVGSLYQQGDPRRDRAFTLFYMGINLGAFFSPFVCGTLGQKVGWHWGFGAAGVGMIIGLLVYHGGRKELPPDEFERAHERGEVKGQVTTTKEEWGRIWALVILCMVNVVFWAVYEQQGNTLQLWADEATDWTVFGWEMPSTWYQAYNPAFIFLFAPLLDRLWAKQFKKGKEPSSVVKMGIGCVLLGLAFVIMIGCVRVNPGAGKVSPWWLITATWLMTMGELYLSPIGLSLVTKVSPARMVSMMMGMWFLSSFLGNYLSGWIGGYYEIMTKESFFTLLLVMGVASGFIFFAAQKPLKKMMGSAAS
jgi:POT family proton-dependent oligopeptide transporter